MIRAITHELIKNGISLPYVLYCLENIPEDIEDLEIFNKKELEFFENISEERKSELIKTYFEISIKYFDIEIPDTMKKQLKNAKDLGFSAEGLCYDLQNDCHDDYEFDIVLPMFIKNNTKTEKEHGILISKLYKVYDKEILES